MKIFEKDGRIHLQLMNLTTKTMLFDFSVEKAFFNELRDHIIANLENYTLSEVDVFLEEVSKSLEPKTHCCECTPGDNYDVPHGCHIQYPDCKCNPEKFVLKRN